MNEEINEKLLKKLEESKDKEATTSAIFMGLFGFILGVACTIGWFSGEIFG